MKKECTCNCPNCQAGQHGPHCYGPGKKTLGVIGFLILIFAITIIASWSTQLVTPQSNRAINAVVTNKGESFNVQGQAQIETMPDEARITLGVQSVETTVKASQDQVNLVVTNLTNALTDLGIKSTDIKTTDYSIYPNYDYSDSGRGQITGYNASTSVNITVHDFNLLNQAIDAATNAGVNQVSGINFTLSNEKQDQVKAEARTIAINNAKGNATELANLTGMQLGKIIDVQENTGNSYYPMSYAAENLKMADSSGMGGGEMTSLNPGSTTYNYSVTLSYQTL